MAHNISSIWLTTVADPAIQDRIWDIYVQAFTTHRVDAVAEQMVYDRQAFIDALIDGGVRKLIVDVDGSIEGFCFLTDDLEKARVNYVNPDFIKLKYPVDFANRTFHYCTVLAVTPASQGSLGLFQKVIDEVADLIVSLDGRILFDCSNNVNAWLPHAIKRAMAKALAATSKPIDKLDLKQLGSQDYWLLDLTK